MELHQVEAILEVLKDDRMDFRGMTQEVIFCFSHPPGAVTNALEIFRLGKRFTS